MLTFLFSIIILVFSAIYRVLSLPILLIDWLFKSEQRVQRYFEGKTVIITGASSGIGEALALTIIKLGSNVVLCGRNIERLSFVASSCQKLKYRENQKIVTWPLDISDYNSIEAEYQQLSSKLKDLGIKCVDILINNAGVSSRGEFVSTTNLAFEKVFNTNFMGPVALTRVVVNDMINNNLPGDLIMMSSVQGKLAIPCRTAYSASKHALQGFCDSLRLEVLVHGINVLVESPGYVSTSLSLNAVQGDGSSYNITDPTTAKGMSPFSLAEKVVHDIADRKKDVIVADLKTNLALSLKATLPEIVMHLLKIKK